MCAKNADMNFINLIGHKMQEFKKPAMKKAILKILSDKQWHGYKDLSPVGSSYATRISQLRLKDRFLIEGRREEGKATYEYRLIGELDYSGNIFKRPKIKQLTFF